MSADLLRDAAHEIRVDVSATDRWRGDDVAFVLAVAAWLDKCADTCTPQGFVQPQLALNVARAYLGDPS